MLLCLKRPGGCWAGSERAEAAATTGRQVWRPLVTQREMAAWTSVVQGLCREVMKRCSVNLGAEKHEETAVLQRKY